MDSQPTASIIIIGDEILNGQTKDTNSSFICEELYKIGVRVKHISVIDDSIESISKEVLDQWTKYTYIITSGGIGITPDDVTYKGIAKAFNENLVIHEGLSKIFMRLGFKKKFANRLSCIPQSSEIHHTSNSNSPDLMPIVSVNNVFIFPGIPVYLEATFLKLIPIFNSNALSFYTKNIYLGVSEFDLVDILDLAVKEFDNVKIGSYPNVLNDHYKVKIFLESVSKNSIELADAFLRSHFPPNSIVGEFPPCSEKTIDKFYAFLKDNTLAESSFKKCLEKSLEVLEQSFNKYTIEEVCLSFNGGKDCTALLHLVYLYITKKYSSVNKKLKVFYVHSQQSFAEVEEFVSLCTTRYNLEVCSYEPPMKKALFLLKSDHPKIQAVLMGCRQTDPRCSDLTSFQTTDNDWPKFMRINPFINWSYSQVWEFIQTLDISYCSLYDKGYTSIGCKHNTLPNEQLLATRKDGVSYYLPAYLLKDSSNERNGRIINKM